MDEAELQTRLYRLQEEHRDLDVAIDALTRDPAINMLRVARLKRQKLRLKDEISTLSSLLTPDIIA